MFECDPNVGLVLSRVSSRTLSQGWTCSRDPTGKPPTTAMFSRSARTGLSALSRKALIRTALLCLCLTVAQEVCLDYGRKKLQLALQGGASCKVTLISRRLVEPVAFLNNGIFRDMVDKFGPRTMLRHKQAVLRFTQQPIKSHSPLNINAKTGSTCALALDSSKLYKASLHLLNPS